MAYEKEKYSADYFKQDDIQPTEEETTTVVTEKTTTLLQPKSVGKFTKLFASPHEKLVSVLGNSYAERFLSSNTISCGFIILSDKRVYMAREVVGVKQKMLAKATDRNTIDVEDITRTGFYHVNAFGYIIASILFAITIIGLPIGLIFLYLYFKNRESLYLISFAGGDFALKLDWLKMSEIEKFERDLRLLKDTKRGGTV